MTKRTTMRKRSLLRKTMSVICVLAIIAGSFALPSHTVSAKAATSYVKVSRFHTMLKEVCGEDTWNEGDSFYESEGYLTNEVAAVMLERADVAMSGQVINTNLMREVKDGKRIADIKKVSKKDYKESIYRVFTKGLMVGKSNGTYSQNRKFLPKEKVTAADARTYVKRLKDRQKRIALTPDGQVTRTTNLPKNYRKYAYILASFPNSYYEKELDYQMLSNEDGSPLVNLKDYASPKDVWRETRKDTGGREHSFQQLFNNYGKDIMDNIYATLELRFNYDYRNTQWAPWKEAVANTFIGSQRSTINRWLENWKKFPVKYKSVVKTKKIVVDRSGIYMSNGFYYARCYVRFKVKTNKMVSAKSFDQNGYIFGETVFFEGLKNNTWYDAVIDVPFGAGVGNDDGRYFGIIGTDLIGR